MGGQRVTTNAKNKLDIGNNCTATRTETIGTAIESYNVLRGLLQVSIRSYFISSYAPVLPFLFSHPTYVTLRYLCPLSATL